MKKFSLVPIALVGMSVLTLSAPAHAVVEFDQNVTPDVIFGSGNTNGSFTTDRANGIELGLRGKLRFDAAGKPQNIFNSNGDGTYSFQAIVAPTQAFPTAEWSFEWTVNSDSTDPVTTALGGLTYVLGLDTDPTLGTAFITFDPINIPCGDHSTGNNSTDDTTDTSRNCKAPTPDIAGYTADLLINNVAQNSWQPHWINPGLDPTVAGTYSIYLEAYDGANLLARTEIQVLVGGAPPVVQPTVDVDSYDMPNGSFGGGIAGIYADNTYDGVGNVGAACDPLSGGTGELTDGTIATAAYANPNWVGWASTALDDGGFPGCPDPTIDFNFLSATAFEKVTIHAWDAGGFGQIVYPASISVTVGTNAPRVFPLAGDGSGVDSLELPLGGDVGDTVSVAFVHGGKWLFLTEVSFNGYVFQPVAADDTATLTEDDPATTIDVLANDDDDGGPAMSIASVDTTGTIGSVVITNDGADLTYEPTENYCNDGGSTDNFTYTLTPGGSTATVAVTVTCVNDAPVAVDNNYNGLEDTQQAGNVITDDTGEGVDFDVDGDAVSVFSNTPASNGVVQLNPDGSFTYDPTANYCGPDSFDYVLTDDVSATPPSLTSNTATVSITVVCVNDAPVAVDNSYSGDEDKQQSGNVIVDNTGEGVDSDVDGDGMTIFSNTDVEHGDLVLNTDGSFTYDPNPNYCGPDSFDYVITDKPAATRPSMISNTATVSITVVCVNDPPTVTSVVPDAQTSDYSDYIGTVIISVNDVDNVSTTLKESNEPPLSAAGLSLSLISCSVKNTESPYEDGSDCTWSYNGQVVDPGDNVHAILFTASDDDGAGSVTGTHTLTIVPEEATVVLAPGNDVALQVAEDGGNSGPFSLFFMAAETTPDLAHIGSPEFGDLNGMVPFMNLVPVGPGGPIAGACSFIAPLPDYPGEGYGQMALFECAFNEVPVNTYEVIAQVDGASDTTRYYTGADDAVLVIFDPSLGFTTGGGWFYWPGTANPELLTCGEDGYAGDKTNFGFNMKYNKKRTNVQGSLLLMRHTVDENCEDADKFRVKSNALDGLSIGDDTDDDGDYGWAAFSGKSVYGQPGMDNEGNHPFLVYVEDHSDQGGNQDPADEFWIQVKDKDGNVVLETNGPDSDPAGVDGEDGDDVSIENGNIIVPHNTGGKGRK